LASQPIENYKSLKSLTLIFGQTLMTEVECAEENTGVIPEDKLLIHSTINGQLWPYCNALANSDDNFHGEEYCR
jgi:hypothetical protein